LNLAQAERQSARSRRAFHSLGRGELAAMITIGDVVSAALGAYLAPIAWAYFDPEFAPRIDLRVLEAAYVVAWVILLHLFGRVDAARPGFGRRTLTSLARTTLAACALALVVFFLAPFFAPRGATLLTLPLIAAFTLAWRYSYLGLLGAKQAARRVAIVGTDEAAKRIASAIMRGDRATRYDVVAFIASDDEDGEFAQRPPTLRIGDEPWAAISELDIDLLVVGHTRGVPATLLAELTHCFEHGIEAIPATILYEKLTGRVLASALEADWYAELPTYTRGLYMPTKRLCDIAIALVGGSVTLLLAPLIAAAIVLESGGPVIHRQLRVGRRGELFVVHKFRSMRADAESDQRPRWAALNDDRITGVGRILRRTRLDELPQLWDVLRGRMSVIGPRPERPEFVEQLARELPLYRARTLVRPGITGWAQVEFPYAGSVEENLAKLEFDLYYLRHLGPALDLAIAIRTVGTVLRLRGR
jgi:exopolysaccharide biosynthesis polyprenyl glycosylphosphotransferase